MFSEEEGTKRLPEELPAPYSPPYISPIETIVDTSTLSALPSVHTSTRTKAQNWKIKEIITKLIMPTKFFD